VKTFTLAEQTVLKILAYAAVFGGWVKVTDLLRFQNGSPSFSQAQLRQASTSLWESGVLLSSMIPGKPDLHQEKWRHVGHAIQFLRRFPEIESIWVTGSVAVGDIHPEDDIDLMIVTTSNSLWWTRSLVSGRDFLSRRIRRRQDHLARLRNKWCCNLWLENGSLSLPPEQRSLYSAREVIQAIPVFQRRRGAAEEFLLENEWVRERLPVGYQQALKRAHALPVWSQSSSFPLPRLKAQLNTLLFRLQKSRMHSYQRNEIVECNRAFFHPGERAKEVQREYERILRLVLP